MDDSSGGLFERTGERARDGARLSARGAALATVVGVLIEVPVMLMLVRICQRTQGWFAARAAAAAS